MAGSPTQPVLFSQAAADRIGRAVQMMEGMKPGQPLPTITYPTQQTFWAIITSPTYDGRRYHFMRVAPDPTNSHGEGTEIRVGGPNGITYHLMGDMGMAMEANDNKSVPLHTIARVDYIGIDAEGLPAFLFAHSGVPMEDFGVAPHDHRDNYNGGLAMAVWHPGTSLPQMPWAL